MRDKVVRYTYLYTLWFINYSINIQMERTGIHASRCDVLFHAALRDVVDGSHVSYPHGYGLCCATECVFGVAIVLSNVDIYKNNEIIITLAYLGFCLRGIMTMNTNILSPTLSFMIRPKKYSILPTF